MVVLSGGPAQMKRRVWPVAHIPRYTRSSNSEAVVILYFTEVSCLASIDSSLDLPAGKAI